MSDNPFGDLTRNESNHYTVHFYAAVFMLVRFLRSLEPPRIDDDGEPLDPLDTVLERDPFLGAYLETFRDRLPDALTWQDGAAWWQQAVDHWERPRRGFLPLGRLTSRTSLVFAHRMGLICAGLVEEDARFGDLFARLLPGSNERRATTELIGQIVLDIEPGLAPSPRQAVQPLLDLGLLQTRQTDLAFAERPVAIPEIIWTLFREGSEQGLNGWCDYSARLRARKLKDLAFEADFATELKATPSAVSRARDPLLIVRGTGGSERVEVMRSLARSMRANTLVIRAPGKLSGEQQALIAPLALLAQAIPVLLLNPGPGDTFQVPRLPGYSGVVGIVMGMVGGIDTDAMARALVLTLPHLGPSERETRWRKSLDDYAPEDLSCVVERYLLPGEHINNLANATIAYARLGGRSQISEIDVARAHRELNRQWLDKHASLVTTNLPDVPCAHTDATESGQGEDPWMGLAVGDTLLHKLKELEQRCRYRERLMSHLGPAFADVSNRGVRALFNGPSGTGKTLAARKLARVVGMDLYRVDLAAIVNKYIGETEKNLHQVLSRAEELDVILLIDEGDALLGKRTEVSNANDRYANLETNYLLQRLEDHQGIVLVTTNAGDHIDSAFQRRMDVVLNFTPPKSQARARIWRLHLGETPQISDAELDALATRVDFTGGQIRNASVLATLYALQETNGVLLLDHVQRAIEAEFQKAGSISRLPDDNGAGTAAQGVDMEAYIAGLKS